MWPFETGAARNCLERDTGNARCKKGPALTGRSIGNPQNENSLEFALARSPKKGRNKKGLISRKRSLEGWKGKHHTPTEIAFGFVRPLVAAHQPELAINHPVQRAALMVWHEVLTAIAPNGQVVTVSA